MNLRSQITRMAAGTVVLLSLVCLPGLAQSTASLPTPSLVEIYWKESQSVTIPGMSSITILDEQIARVETTGQAARFFGIERGETVALAFVNEKAVSLRLRVIDKPILLPSPSLLRHKLDLGYGIVGSAVQLANGSDYSTVMATQDISWSQPFARAGRLELTANTEDGSQIAGHNFNIRRASIQYSDPDNRVNLFDFPVNLVNAAGPAYISPFSFSDSMDLRGAKVGLRRGSNEYTLYAGASVPYFYLTLGNTRDVAGFSWQRRQSKKLTFFSSTAFVNAPVTFFSESRERRNSFMQTAGMSFLPNKRWMLAAVAGSSNHGSMLRTEASYTKPGFTAFASGSTSAVLFPLNQIQSLYAGTSTINAGVVKESADWLSESLYYQRSTSKNAGGILRAGSSEYISPSVAIRVARAHNVLFTYTHSRSEGGFGLGTSTGNRLDSNWQWQIASRISNSIQTSIGAVQDRLQLDSEDRYSIRESLAFPVKSAQMSVGMDYNRTNPSLIDRLNEEMQLLSPALQDLFLQDPRAFIGSGYLPPEIRALLDAQHPSSVSGFAMGSIRVGTRLQVNPNVSVSRMMGDTTESWTPLVGYALTYQLKPSFQLTSSLNNTWVFATRQNAQRTTIFSAGFLKSFTAAGDVLMWNRNTRMIEGRVFRDNNVNGTFNAGEPGFANIQVSLENGETTQTDELGRYKFTGVSAGEHSVTVNLEHFRNAVKMTTSNTLDADVARTKMATANFGIVDFARVMGNVFNDLRFQNQRQPDSKGMQGVQVILENEKVKRSAIADGSGQFEMNDIPPGEYTLTVDRGTLPANYMVPDESFPVRVGAVSTALQDVPVRALRSIAGRVLLKSPRVPQNGTTGSQSGAARGKQMGRTPQPGGSTQQDTPESPAYDLIPLEGIQISAGYSTTRTDAGGNFLLRNLPAGDLTISVVPVVPVPAGMPLPTGRVHMPAEPIQVQGATIVISNPELMPYLVGKTVQQIRQLTPPLAPQLPLQSSAAATVRGGRP